MSSHAEQRARGKRGGEEAHTSRPPACRPSGAGVDRCPQRTRLADRCDRPRCTAISPCSKPAPNASKRAPGEHSEACARDACSKAHLRDSRTSATRSACRRDRPSMLHRPNRRRRTEMTPAARRKLSKVSRAARVYRILIVRCSVTRTCLQSLESPEIAVGMQRK